MKLFANLELLASVAAEMPYIEIAKNVHGETASADGSDLDDEQTIVEGDQRPCPTGESKAALKASPEDISSSNHAEQEDSEEQTHADGGIEDCLLPEVDEFVNATVRRQSLRSAGSFVESGKLPIRKKTSNRKGKNKQGDRGGKKSHLVNKAAKAMAASNSLSREQGKTSVTQPELESVVALGAECNVFQEETARVRPQGQVGMSQVLGSTAGIGSKAGLSSQAGETGGRHSPIPRDEDLGAPPVATPMLCRQGMTMSDEDDFSTGHGLQDNDVRLRPVECNVKTLRTSQNVLSVILIA
ncbi:hypothetical protein CYLTODRAFT_494584 [Cylindrobasidium torrendii FP15055 ss-10]|uniref:Uncharacterized protein n=1 Tax=Cylindrobasidium torrendii FP15055 ss-10 TaxID=1314674 RepID=A0A0D7AZ09_9AGAR|nr:hypothetical protein CYLTODRAFT_494584 [Cylindrobasidium torrendii FP15055 ss-10]